MSPAAVPAKFDTDGSITNLDRCARCGDLRSAHGPDWSCPAGAPRAAAVIAPVSLVLGALLAVSGLIVVLTVGTSTSWSDLGTAAAVSGFALLLISARLRHPGAPPPA